MSSEKNYYPPLEPKRFLWSSVESDVDVPGLFQGKWEIPIRKLKTKTIKLKNVTYKSQVAILLPYLKHGFLKSVSGYVVRKGLYVSHDQKQEQSQEVSEEFSSEDLPNIEVSAALQQKVDAEVVGPTRSATRAIKKPSLKIIQENDSCFEAVYKNKYGVLLFKEVELGYGPESEIEESTEPIFRSKYLPHEAELLEDTKLESNRDMLQYTTKSYETLQGEMSLKDIHTLMKRDSTTTTIVPFRLDFPFLRNQENVLPLCFHPEQDDNNKNSNKNKNNNNNNYSVPWLKLSLSSVRDVIDLVCTDTVRKHWRPNVQIYETESKTLLEDTELEIYIKIHYYELLTEDYKRYLDVCIYHKGYRYLSAETKEILFQMEPFKEVSKWVDIPLQVKYPLLEIYWVIQSVGEKPYDFPAQEVMISYRIWLNNKEVNEETPAMYARSVSYQLVRGRRPPSPFQYVYNHPYLLEDYHTFSLHQIQSMQYTDKQENHSLQLHIKRLDTPSVVRIFCRYIQPSQFFFKTSKNLNSFKALHI